MNKQLAKLYERALVIEDGGDYVSGELDPAKFADLIVQECVGVLKRRFMGDLNREDMEVRRCIEDVRKHFGVEG